MLREYLKTIDRSLSIKILNFPIGLVPFIKGINGRRKILASDKMKLVAAKGYQSVDFATGTQYLLNLKKQFDRLESDKNNFQDLALTESSSLRTCATVIPGSTTHQRFNEKIAKLFDLDLEILEISYYRNYHIPESDRNKLSGDWHFDRRPQDWMRLFILPCETGEENGPLEATDIKTSGTLLSTFGYSRSSPHYQSKIDSVLRDCEVTKFVGQVGQALLVDTQRVLHRAGVPRKNCSRDMVQVIIRPQ